MWDIPMSSVEKNKLEKYWGVAEIVNRPLDAHAIPRHGLEPDISFFDASLFSTLPFIPDFSPDSMES
jgi:hypothetical protein